MLRVRAHRAVLFSKFQRDWAMPMPESARREVEQTISHAEECIEAYYRLQDTQQQDHMNMEARTNPSTLNSSQP